MHIIYIHEKIQVDQSEGIYSLEKLARHNPKGADPIWRCDLSIGKVLRNKNLTNWVILWDI